MGDHEYRRSRTQIAISTFLFWAALYLYVPILPVYARSLGASLSMVGAVIASYAIAQVFLRIPTGVGADALGSRKSLVMGGLVAVTIGAIGLGLASNPWLLFLARATTGFGAATWVAFSVLYASYYPRDQTGRAIGQISFVNGAALLAAAAAGGAIAQAWGLQAPFFGAAVLGVASLVAVLPVREPALPASQPVSWSAFLRVASDPLLLTVSFMGIVVHFATFSGVFGFIPVRAAQIGASSVELGVITMLALGSGAFAALASSHLAERWGYS